MLMFLDPRTLQQHPAPGTQNTNQSIAYMEHSDTKSAIDDCRRCDPQLDSIPSSCAYGASYGHAQMIELGDFNGDKADHKFAQVLLPSLPPDLGVQLSSLGTLLSALNDQLQAPPAGKDQRVAMDASGNQENPTKDKASDGLDPKFCSAPGAKLPDLTGKFPTLSQLTCVERYLESKAIDLDSRQCRDQKTARNGAVSLPCDDARNTARVQIRGMLSDVQRAMKSGTSGKDCRAAIMMVQIQ
jgi:hypothetical protein